MDWTQLLELRDSQLGGDPDIVSELVNCFVADSATRIELLREAALRGDIATVAIEAHSLKGSVGYFGVPAFHAAAEALEHAAKDRVGMDYTAAVERLATDLAAIHAALAAGPGVQLSPQ